MNPMMLAGAFTVDSLKLSQRQFNIKGDEDIAKLRKQTVGCPCSKVHPAKNAIMNHPKS